MHVFKLPALYNTKLTVVTSYKATQRNMLKSFAYLRSKIFPKAYNVYIALRNKVIFLALYIVQCVERSKPQRNIEWISGISVFIPALLDASFALIVQT